MDDDIDTELWIRKEERRKKREEERLKRRQKIIQQQQKHKKQLSSNSSNNENNNNSKDNNKKQSSVVSSFNKQKEDDKQKESQPQQQKSSVIGADGWISRAGKGSKKNNNNNKPNVVVVPPKPQQLNDNGDLCENMSIASGTSSVTFSQQQQPQQTGLSQSSEQQQSSNNNTPLNKTIRAATADESQSSPPSATKAKTVQRKNTKQQQKKKKSIFIDSDSSSSSDDSDGEDLVALSKKLQNKANSNNNNRKEQQQQQQSPIVSKQPSKAAAAAVSSPQEDDERKKKKPLLSPLSSPSPSARQQQQRIIKQKSKPAAARRRKGWNNDSSDDSSSDSDNDDDLVQFSRKLEINNNNQKDNNTNNGNNNRNSNNNDDDDSDDSFYNTKKKMDTPQQQQQNNNGNKKVNDSLWNDYDSSDDQGGDDSSDDDNGKLVQNKGTFIRVEDLIVKDKKKKKKQSMSSYDSGSDDDNDSDDGFVRVEDMILNKKKKKKQQQQMSKSPKKKKKPKKKKTEGDDEESDNNNNETPKKKRTPQKQQKKKSSTPSTRKTNRYDSSDDESSESESESDEDNNNGDVSSTKLKPNFHNPRWVSDFIPLELGDANDDIIDDVVNPPPPSPSFVTDNTTTENTTAATAADNNNTSNNTNTTQIQVPSSINRYLKDYQREGIKFMYNGISNDKGVILGHDMGMGKTIQVIALLAALLKKTGTGFDLLEIKQHRQAVSEQQKKKKHDIEQALLEGRSIQDILNNNNNDDNNDNDNAMKQVQSRKRYVPILIIVPSSVISNWGKEFETWGYFGVCLYHGKNRTSLLEKIKNGTCEILVIGKSLFSSDQSDDYEQIQKISWKLCIVDEYHEYKNDKSKAYKHLRDLNGTNSCPIIGLTGTVMQNEHRELFNLINLVQPNFLGSWSSFEHAVCKPVKYGRTKDAKNDLIEKSHQRIKELQEVLKPVLLIKKKDDVLELTEALPMKDEKVVFCELSYIQKVLYQHILNLPEYELLRLANAPCDCGINQQFFTQYKKLRSKKEKMDFQRRHHSQVTRRKECCYQIPLNPRKDEADQPLIDPRAVLWKSFHPNNLQCNPKAGPGCPYCMLLPALNKLYQVCSHAALIQGVRDPNNIAKGSKERIEAEKQLQFAKVAVPPNILQDLPGGSYIRQDGIMDDHKLLSGKMEALDKLLRACEKRDDRILLFSYSTTMLDLIQHYIKAEGHTFLRLDGSTPTMHRQELIDEFQNNKDIFIFLISTRAGGLGLNLTAANVVIVFDVNWNPSYDEQAQDRAYRIGQSKDVQVIRLVARGTIEEQKYIRQVYKVQLKQETLGKAGKEEGAARIFRGVAGDKNRKGELFGSENLLKYKDGSFMADMWKSADDRLSKKLGGVEIHRTEDLSNAITGMSPDEIECIGGNGQFDEVFDKAASGHAGSNHKNALSPDRKANDIPIDENAINHEDFLRGGQAAVQEGDEGFDEEMGGLSQVVYNVMEKDAMNDGMDDGSAADIETSDVEDKDETASKEPGGTDRAKVERGSPRFVPNRATGSDIANDLKKKEKHNVVVKQERIQKKKTSIVDPIIALDSDSEENCVVKSNEKLPAKTMAKKQKQAQKPTLNGSKSGTRRRRQQSDVKLLGVSSKKIKTSKVKSKFTVADILGKGLD